MLTDLQCRKAKVGEKDYKLADARGLYLFVTKTGVPRSTPSRCIKMHQRDGWRSAVPDRRTTRTFMLGAEILDRASA